MKRILYLLIPSLFITAAYQVTYAQSTINVGIPVNSCSAHASATGACTTFALPPIALQITWQSSFGSAPSSITLQLQTSNDNSTWATVDTSTSTAGEARTLTTSAAFIRVNINAISGGTAVTVSINAKGGAQALDLSGNIIFTGTVTNTGYMLVGTAQADLNQTPFGDNLPAISDNHHFFGISSTYDGEFTAAVTAYGYSTNNSTDVEALIAVAYATGSGVDVGATFGAYYDGGMNTTSYIAPIQAIATLISGSADNYINAGNFKVQNQGTGTFPSVWIVHASNTTNSGGGSIPWNVAFYSDAQGNDDIGNSYDFWANERGVFRIKADKTFNGVYQAIPALYNPQYAQYIAGTPVFERGILGQWNSNVLEIGAERGAAVTLTSVTSTGTTATATAAGSVTFANGAVVTIAGANEAEYNGSYTISSPSENNVFTYTFAGSVTTPATGTITARGGTLRDVRLIGAHLDVGAFSGSGGSLPVCSDTNGQLYLGTNVAGVAHCS